MGSGSILAIVVVLWFVVLVPMVLTHRDLARDAAAADRLAPSTRVLRRRSEDGHGRAPESSPAARRRSLDRRSTPMSFTAPSPAASDDRAAQVRRRRHTLLALVSIAMLCVVLAVFVSAHFWAGHVGVDMLILGYLIHL